MNLALRPAYNQKQDSHMFSIATAMANALEVTTKFTCYCINSVTSIRHSSSLQVQDPLRFECFSHGLLSCERFPAMRQPTPLRCSSKRSEELADIRWDNLGFNPIPTDYMYIMKCYGGENFSDGELRHFGNIELNPSASVLNYGQGIIEGLKAQKKQDKSVILFRLEQNALRMRLGAQRMCMPAPTVEQFVEAVKATVLANRRWVPPPNKGFLHIRPLLMGSWSVLSLTPATEFVFLIYVTPVGNYFEEGIKPIDLVVEIDIHRATPGGVGGIKAIGNYASITKAQARAKENGFTDVLYVDAIHKRYLEEVSTANIFLVKGKTIITPELSGTILPGVTRKSIIEIAPTEGFQVEERVVSVEELFEADEVFCTGNAICLLPVGSITYKGKRVSYGESGLGNVSRQLYLTLRNIQMGLAEDKMGWTCILT